MPYPSETLYPSESLYPGAGGETISRIREATPLRLSVDAEAPSGKHFRWSGDADAPFAPNGISFSTTIPGGFEELGLTLRRRPKENYGDLSPYSNLRVTGAGGQLAWEGRLEGTPRSSGDDMAINPNAVGWQAALEDDQTALVVYVDRDLGSWADATGARRLAIYNVFSGLFYNVLTTPSVEPGDDGEGALRLNLDERASVGAACESWYDSRTGLSSVYYAYEGKNLAAADVGAISGSSDSVGTTTTTGTDVVTGATPSGTQTETAVSGYRYAFASLSRAATTINSDADRQLVLSDVAVYGNHGLTKQGTEPEAGFYASDIIDHAVSTWAPGLSRNIDQTGFVIPHLVYLDYTTAAEIVRDANRFHLWDWGVWDDKTFHYYEQGRRGRNWRARIGPTNLQEAGPQMDRIYNGVLVSYPDVDGTTRTAGPTGSGADTESDDLIDSDQANPANAAGLRRWAKIESSAVTTAAGATEIGRRFLAQSAQTNTSGQATIVGVCIDDHGVRRPAWQIRAGDTIQFTDAADTSPRRIIRTSYDADTLTCSIDLDSPPEGLDALLERLSVTLTGFNF